MRNKHFYIQVLFYLILCSNAVAQERDPNFGINGFVKADLEGYDKGLDVFIQNDNKIISIGATAEHPIYADDIVAIIRYNYNGSLDTTYGDSGVIKLKAFNYSQTFYYDAGLQSDQKLVVGGQYSTNRFMLRYNNDGSLDSTFVNNGIVQILDDDYYRDYFFLELGNDDEIMILRRFQENYQANYLDSVEYALYRHTPDGDLDSLYGTDGRVDITLDSLYSYYISDFKLLDNGEMLLHGRRNGEDEWGTETSELVLMKLLPDGSRDSTFGVNGIATGPVLALSDLDVHSTGKIVCVGTTNLNQQGTVGNMSICRFNENGSIDSSFSEDGSTSLSIDVYADYANAVCIQANGKILVGGSFFNFSGGSVTDNVIVRYNVDGVLDSTFSEDGIFKNGLSSGTDIISEMALQGSNKVVYIGFANYSTFDIITGRLNTDNLVATPDTAICLGDSAILYAYSDSLILGWAIDTLPDVLLSTNSTLQISPSIESTYLVYTAYDTAYVNVSFKDLPTVELLSDTSICENEELVLNASYPEATYLWQDSSNTSLYTISTSGTYHVRVTNSCGSASDTSIITVNPLPIVNLGADLTLCENDSLLLDVFIENASYLWQDSSTNATYSIFESGNYWVETSLNNCVNRDSIDVIFNGNTYSFLEITACDSLISPSSFYTWYESGSYNDTLQNANGCDSIISINANITTIDNSLSQSGNNLTSNALGVTYQWIDCNTNEAIAGETNQSFSPLQNGSYAVMLNDSLCSSISACYTISSLNLSEVLNKLGIKLYPNPTKGIINIQKMTPGEINIKLSDIEGRLLVNETSFASTISIDLSSFSKGIYQVIIQQEQVFFRTRVIKN